MASKTPGALRLVVLANPHMRMTPLRQVTALALIACPLAWACGSRHDTMRDIKDATIPHGDSAPVLEDPVPDGQGLRFSWEFTTRSNGSDYLDWVTTPFSNRGFTVVRRDVSSIHLNKTEGGDSYRMQIEIVSGSPTHVRVNLRVSPD
jgi:hypothetical protein